MSEFREVFSKARNIAIVTGAGVSAESGVPTFRGENEKWRKWQSQVSQNKTNTHTRAHVFFIFLFRSNSCVWSDFQLWFRVVAVEWVYYRFT